MKAFIGRYYQAGTELFSYRGTGRLFTREELEEATAEEEILIDLLDGDLAVVPRAKVEEFNRRGKL